MKNKPMLKWMLVFCGGWIFFHPGKGVAQVQELGLKRFLSLAEQNSPSLKAASYREDEVKQSARVADSGFFPTLDAAALDSSGFPGSASGLDGFSGLAASPYRKGGAVDAFVKWDLLDLSQWSRSAAAHDEVDAIQAKTKFQTAVVDQKALEIYLATVLLRGNRDAWQGLVDELTEIQNTVKRFVRNGQYSEVQGILIQDQLSEALLQVDDYDRQYQAGLARIALLTGLGDKSFSCPSPAQLTGGELGNLQNLVASPFVTLAQLEAKASHEVVSKYSMENLPKLEVAGSAGFMDETRLEPSQNYSVFVGVTFPIFEGFRIDAEEKGAEAEARAKDADVAAAQLALDDLNIGYGESILQFQDDLTALQDEQGNADRAVILAKQRYLSFLGPLSDLQQALKDKVDVDVRLEDVKTRLLLAEGNRYLVNGGVVDALP